MSVAALNWAFELPLDDPSVKAVLTALANHADARGNCWPSVRTICRYTGWTPRTVHAALKRAETMGALTVRRSPGGGNDYRLNFDFSPKTSATVAPARDLRQRENCAPTSATNVKTGATVAPEPLEPSVEPVEARKPRRAQARRAMISLDWQPGPDETALARELGHDPPTITVKFRDYWIGVGKPMADWNATFRNWCRREKFPIKANGAKRTVFSEFAS